MTFVSFGHRYCSDGRRGGRGSFSSQTVAPVVESTSVARATVLDPVVVVAIVAVLVRVLAD